MKMLMPVIAILGLGLTVVPSMMVFSGTMELELHKKLMTVGTILWFIAAPLWFKKGK